MGRKRSLKKRISEPRCGNCGATMIQIVYGYPSESMFRDAARGKIALGGCVITGSDPQWTCSADCDVKPSGGVLDS